MKNGNSELEEFEANQFAIELLMPTHMVLEDLKNAGDLEDGNLCEMLMKKYKVSGTVVAMRLASL